MIDDLPLVDLQFGISQLSGNKPLFISLLGKFKEEYLNINAKLDTAVQHQEMNEAKHLVHTLKGVSGNLGMRRLHQASKDFEQCLKDASELNNSLTVLTETVTATLDEINRLSNDDTPQTETATSNQSSPNEHSKQQLIDALNRNEYIPHAKLSELIRSLDMSPNNQAALEKAISDLDYPVALNMLQSS